MRDDDPPKDPYELRPVAEPKASGEHVLPAGAKNVTFMSAEENVFIGGNEQTLALRSIHPDVLMAKARARSVHGLLWIIGVTVVLGFVGIFVLSSTGHPTDALREILQTALAAEVAVLASSLGRSGG